MILAIVQARMGSARLPNKVMRLIEGVPMIEVLLRRLNKSQKINRIILATSTSSQNQPLADHVRSLGFDVFQGSENDVLDRYYQAAKIYQPDSVVRITGDCPLIDARLVDQVIAGHEAQGGDYFCNNYPPTFPDGLDTEVFSYRSLEVVAEQAQSGFDREHVTPFFRHSGLFVTGNCCHEENLATERWTVDEEVDFRVISRIFRHFAPRFDFSWQEVWQLRQSHPQMFEENQHIVRNEGAGLGTGQKLWKRAKQVIPGGSMLLSKRAEMFLPEQWPSYFSRAKGCRVWDLDGREYIDMSIMGIGTNILGYGDPEIDEAVMRTIAKGNMSTLNCPEEVYLAEKLIEIHPWAEMVRLARTGGEANAIAIRIARAASGREKVAICGYHGWHDWYLSANLGDENSLTGHLLPGLEPKGVPTNLRGTIFPFTYNNFAELEQIVTSHDIGVINMEVSRNHEPKANFLHRVRELATARGIVLVFDECTSGFRQSYGGLHKLYGVEPDMAMFGKALGNGYAITAVIGRRAVMEAAQNTFISSTFWTERIGPSAGLKTLEIMFREKSWEQVTLIGKKVKAGWMSLAQKYNLAITTSGLPALASFTFNYPASLAYKSLLTQEMLAAGFLAGTSFYPSTQHSAEVINKYFEALDPVFAMIGECEGGGANVYGLLKGPVCQGGFKRLN